jgi:hypothetical protein
VGKSRPAGLQTRPRMRALEMKTPACCRTALVDKRFWSWSGPPGIVGMKRRQSVLYE